MSTQERYLATGSQRKVNHPAACNPACSILHIGMLARPVRWAQKTVKAAKAQWHMCSAQCGILSVPTTNNKATRAQQHQWLRTPCKDTSSLHVITS